MTVTPGRTTLRRRPDWRARLAAAIEAKRRVPIGGGYHCGIFLADCILAMTDVDLAEGYRGMDIDAAFAVLRSHGHADLAAFAAARLEEIHPVRARAGDVMLYPAEGTGWAGGIVTGERVTVLRGDMLGTVSRDDATRAFRVP